MSKEYISTICKHVSIISNINKHYIIRILCITIYLFASYYYSSYFHIVSIFLFFIHLFLSTYYTHTILGSGSLFGEQQSGSTDIGIDLQTRILSEAFHNLKTEVMLSVTDTRITLGMNIEKLRDHDMNYLNNNNFWLFQPIIPNNNNNNNNNSPDSNSNEVSNENQLQMVIEKDLNQVSIWEDQMIELILDRIFQEKEKVSSDITTTTTGTADTLSDTAGTDTRTVTTNTDSDTTDHTNINIQEKSVNAAIKSKSKTKTKTIDATKLNNTKLSSKISDVYAGVENIKLKSILNSVLTSASSEDFQNVYQTCLENYNNKLRLQTNSKKFQNVSF